MIKNNVILHVVSVGFLGLSLSDNGFLHFIVRRSGLKMKIMRKMIKRIPGLKANTYCVSDSLSSTGHAVHNRGCLKREQT